VVGELRKVHLDETMSARLTTEVTVRVERARQALLIEERALPGELARTAAEASKIAEAIGTASPTAKAHLERRLEEVSRRLARQKARADEVRRRTAHLAGVRADVEWVAGVLGDFDRLWKRLTNENRARVVRALVAEVRVDEANGMLRIELRGADSRPEAA
jgi:hypothetical protein